MATIAVHYFGINITKNYYTKCNIIHENFILARLHINVQ